MKNIIIVFSLAFCFGYAPAQQVIVNSNPTTNDRFSKKAGSLRLSHVTVKLGRIASNETRSDTVRIFNDGPRPLSISPGKLPAHITMKTGVSSLAPQADSWVVVHYDASKRKDLGFVLDRIELVTSDSVQPKKAINITATITEYFAPLTAEDSAVVQKARWLETVYDYGKIKQGDKVTHNFGVVNDGKKELIIRKIKTSCGCLKTSASLDTIQPGGTGYVTVEFDSNNKEGKDSRKLNVYLNDPARPDVVLEMRGEILKP